MPKHYATRLAAALRAGHGAERLYDEYGIALYGYCWALLGERTEAAGALTDAVLVAAAHADALADPGDLTPWVFALARTECRRRRPDVPPAASPYQADPSADVITMLVGRALADVRPADRELIDLTVRYRLTEYQLAKTLGEDERLAAELAEAAVIRFDQTLSTLFMASSGRLAVPREMISDRPPLRVLLDLLPPARPPGELRANITAACQDPALDHYRQMVARRALPLREDGFPRRLNRDTQPRTPYGTPMPSGPYGTVTRSGPDGAVPSSGRPYGTAGRPPASRGTVPPPPGRSGAAKRSPGPDGVARPSDRRGTAPQSPGEGGAARRSSDPYGRGPSSDRRGVVPPPPGNGGAAKPPSRSYGGARPPARPYGTAAMPLGAPVGPAVDGAAEKGATQPVVEPLGPDDIPDEAVSRARTNAPASGPVDAGDSVRPPEEGGRSAGHAGGRARRGRRRPKPSLRWRVAHATGVIIAVTAVALAMWAAGQLLTATRSPGTRVAPSATMTGGGGGAAPVPTAVSPSPSVRAHPSPRATPVPPERRGPPDRTRSPYGDADKPMGTGFDTVAPHRKTKAPRKPSPSHTPSPSRTKATPTHSPTSSPT